MRFPVFDLHCDTSFALVEAKGEWDLRSNPLHIDLRRAGAFPGYAQCFACFTSTALHYPQGMDSGKLFSLEQDVFFDEMRKNADVIRQAYSPEDILRHQKEGLMSGILTIEGCFIKRGFE